ncbi:MAG TPA: zf-HC2 domain-containing protein [Terracidiphilus sp.]|nr:zf-HC2 domain-containing protein [Terracidiphilus sp.]
MSDHLSHELLSALVDGELAADQLARVNAHLADCPSCTSGALAQSLLKSATARTGQRYAPPTELQSRLARMVRQEVGRPPESTRSRRPLRAMPGLGFTGWATAFALLIILGGVVVLERNLQQSTAATTEFAGLVTEASDQHIATLAANLPPQVISSDRHTVKPWFQGRIPFSFNLPENLPSDTMLEGANLTYVHGHPAALLLYSIGKHRASIFLMEKSSTELADDSVAEHAGFHVIGFSTADLQAIAVSDVDTGRLSQLVSALKGAQTGDKR